MKQEQINLIGISIVHILPILFYKTSLLFLLSPGLILFQLFWVTIVELSITCGYHRLFNHKSYQAKPIVYYFFLIFGATAIQNSALNWSQSHRLHHRDQDKESDPYNINKGFWHAHVLWLFRENKAVEDQKKTIDISDLKNNKYVALQDKYLLYFTIFGFFIQLGLGSLLGFSLQLLFISTIIRVIVTWNITWSVNSLAHFYGDKPFNNKITPVQNLLVSILTFGEGWHNYHHSYPRDYRASHSDNNIKYWNPSTAFINLLTKLNLVTKRQIASEYNKDKKINKKKK